MYEVAIFVPHSGTQTWQPKIQSVIITLKIKSKNIAFAISSIVLAYKAYTLDF